MKTNIDFVAFVMTHAKNKFPSATYYAPASIGADQWQYLFGTTGNLVTQSLLDDRYDHHYYKKMTRDQYDTYTAGWVEAGVCATDCEGLLDHFVGKDVTANDCFNKWCKEKGVISTDIIPFLATVNAAGCAVFQYDEKSEKMTHIGFIIGRDSDGTPLVGEARGIAYGVTVTRLTDRPFTHWGRPSSVLSFPMSNIVPDIQTVSETKTDPVNTDRITALQLALCAFGYPVTVDGRIGKQTREAAKQFFIANTDRTIFELTVNGEPVFQYIK